jgi:Fe-S cluster assembly ATPase SufC
MTILYMEKYSDSILIMQHMSLLIDKDSKKTHLTSSGEIVSKGDEVINFNNDAVRVYVDKGSRKLM